MIPLLDNPLSPIRDQRHMVGLTTHSTVEEVEAGWERWVQHHGLAVRRRNGDYTQDLHISDLTVVAYVSGSKWIADCPLCRDGIACWSANPRGCCLGCGTIFRVKFPPDAERARAEELLAERSRVEERNWHVHIGETVEQLAEENARLAAMNANVYEGIVSLSDLGRILGPDAVAKLRDAGVGR